MYRKSRRHLTLIELLIALTLTFVLLTTLMGFYSLVESMHQTASAMRRENFQYLHAQHRLDAVLPAIQLSEGNKKKAYWFYTGYDEVNPSLIFVYDNGVDGNPVFSNRVLGKLYVDREGQLVLLTWPVPQRNFEASPPMRREVLLEGIESIGYRFFSPEKGWVEGVWPYDADTLPALVKVDIVMKGKRGQSTFAFLLHKGKHHPVYRR